MDEKKVFISYSRDDKEIVFPLVERLKKDVGDVFWIDLDGVECGAQYEKIIINAIDKAEIVLLMYSENILDSEWVKNEATYSTSSEKKLIPVIISGDKMEGWPQFRYASIDTINIKDSNQYKKLVRDLIKWLGLKKEKKSESISTSTGISHSIARNQNEKPTVFVLESPHTEDYKSDSFGYSRSYGFNNPQKFTSKTVSTTGNNKNKQSSQFNSSSDTIKKSFLGSLNTSEENTQPKKRKDEAAEEKDDNKDWDLFHWMKYSNRDNKDNFLKKNYKQNDDVWKQILTSPSPNPKVVRCHNSTDSSTKKDEEKLESTLTFDYHDQKIKMKRLGDTSYYFGSISGKNDSFIDKLSKTIHSDNPGKTIGALAGSAIAAALTIASPISPLAGLGIWGAGKLFHNNFEIDDCISYLRSKYSLNFKRLPEKYATGQNLDEDIIMLDWNDKEI